MYRHVSAAWPGRPPRGAGATPRPDIAGTDRDRSRGGMAATTSRIVSWSTSPSSPSLHERQAAEPVEDILRRRLGEHRGEQRERRPAHDRRGVQRPPGRRVEMPQVELRQLVDDRRDGRRVGVDRRRSRPWPTPPAAATAGGRERSGRSVRASPPLDAARRAAAPARHRGRGSSSGRPRNSRPNSSGQASIGGSRPARTIRTLSSGPARTSGAATDRAAGRARTDRARGRRARRATRAARPRGRRPPAPRRSAAEARRGSRERSARSRRRPGARRRSRARAPRRGTPRAASTCRRRRCRGRARPAAGRRRASGGGRAARRRARRDPRSAARSPIPEAHAEATNR